MKKYLAALIQKYQIVVFFVVTYCTSWLLWMPLVRYGESQLRILGTFMPTITAIILTFFMEGRLGVKLLLKKLLHWKVNYLWYLFSFFSTAAAVFFAIGIYRLIGGYELQFNDIRQWYLIIVAFVYVLFLSVLGEEIGWRGFALPRLQEYYNALTSSIILGVIWALWHLPLFLMKGNFHESIPITLFVIQGIAVSIIYTWMYNNTKGSLLLAHLFHAASNVTLGVLPVLPIDTGGDVRPLWITVIILVAVAILIVSRYGAENLSRSQRITIKKQHNIVL